MHPPGIDDVEVGPPPLRRAVVGLVLGLVTGALAAALLPREPAQAASDAGTPRHRGDSLLR